MEEPRKKTPVSGAPIPPPPKRATSPKSASSGKAPAPASKRAPSPSVPKKGAAAIVKEDSERTSLARSGGKRKAPKIISRRDPVHKPFPFAAIFCLLVIVAVSMYVLNLRITVDNYTSEISRMETAIAEAKEQENALSVRLNAKYDLTEIERIALDEYGMVSKDSLMKKYVSITGGDEIEVIAPQESGTSSLLSAVANAVDGILT